MPGHMRFPMPDADADPPRVAAIGKRALGFQSDKPVADFENAEPQVIGRRRHPPEQGVLREQVFVDGRDELDRNRTEPPFRPSR